MNWTEIVGHADTIKHLQSMLITERIPHAILFAGPVGIGKFTVAKVFAAALLCSSQDDRPCGTCQSCRQIEYGNHPDYLVVSPEGGSIKIDQVREITRRVSLAPYLSKCRVCIIDEAESMTVQAANSLLKTLEEPTGDVIFLLISSKRQRLLNTIISRCRIISLVPLATSVLAKALIKRGFSRENTEVVARLSGGRMGQALSLLEPDGLVLRDQAANLLLQISEGHMNNLWDMAAALEKIEKKELLKVMDYLTYILRDLILVITGQEQELLFNIDLLKHLYDMAAKWREDSLVKAMAAVDDARNALHANANARLTSEALLIKLYDLI